MGSRIAWVIVIGILGAFGGYSYSCIRVTEQSASFHQHLDELRLRIQNHNARYELVTPSLIVDEVQDLAEQAGVQMDESDVEITAEEVEIARDDHDGCVVQAWPDSAMKLSESDQGRLSLGVSLACPVIPRWVISVRAAASISWGVASRDLVYERYLLVVRYSEDDELE